MLPLTSIFAPVVDMAASMPATAVEMVYFSEAGSVPVKRAVLGVSKPDMPHNAYSVKEEQILPTCASSMIDACSATEVFKLQEQGFVALKVTVPPLFSQRGQLYSGLRLPQPFKVLSVVREGEVLPTSLEAQFVKPADEVFILSQQPDEVRSQFFS
jgi:hypothetical protein